MRNSFSCFALIADGGVRVLTMNDIKNLFIAYFSTTWSVFAAIEAPTLITIVSAVILPIMFFAIGKTVDVLLQVYLDKRRSDR